MQLSQKKTNFKLKVSKIFSSKRAQNRKLFSKSLALKKDMKKDQVIK